MVLIKSRKSIVTATNVCINSSSKFYLTEEQIQSLGDKEFLTASYRRFLRMRQFISKRQMVKESYTTYLRYKFKIEDFELKRSKLLSVSGMSTMDFRSSVQKSLRFLIKAFSTSDSYSRDMVDDSHKCKKIIKNLLTVDYHRNKIINRSSNMYQYYRKDFTFFTDGQNIGLKQFEENLMRLNECLGTRL
ncbi:Irc19 [Kluyveromyces lactis]|nr:Irc19 [Kluyveromyces lactis]